MCFSVTRGGTLLAATFMTKLSRADPRGEEAVLRAPCRALAFGKDEEKETTSAVLSHNFSLVPFEVKDKHYIRGTGMWPSVRGTWEW